MFSGVNRNIARGKIYAYPSSMIDIRTLLVLVAVADAAVATARQAGFGGAYSRQIAR